MPDMSNLRAVFKAVIREWEPVLLGVFCLVIFLCGVIVGAAL